ncbi:MAG: hypothetical protein K2G44_01785 [Clostridia bacterium]|nr:hypothetical protein [Clostridia bacterium]
MTTSHRVRFWYGIFLSVFTVAVGILFLATVADIYFGVQIPGAEEVKFPSEILRAKFGSAQILAPFILWIVAVIVGFVLSVVFPIALNEKRKPDAVKSLSRMRKRMPQGAEGLSEELQSDFARVRKYELARIILWCVSAAVCLASAIATCVYVFNKTNFATKDYNGHMLDMARFVLPFVVVSFACCIAVAIYELVSAKKELPLVKKIVAAIIVGGEKQEVKSKMPAWIQKFKAFCERHDKWILLGVRLAVLVVAIVFIAVGIVNGGMNDVFVKAIQICRECIGIG